MSRRPAITVPVVDNDSGQPIEGLSVTVPAETTRRDKATPTIHRSWGGVDFAYAADLDLTSTQWRIVFVLAGRINRETGLATISIAQIARRLRLNYKTVHSAFAGLRELGIVRSLRGEWRITPELLSRLSLRDWDEVTHLERQLRETDAS